MLRYRKYCALIHLMSKPPLTGKPGQTDPAREVVTGYNRFLVRARQLLGPDVTALRLHILLTVYAHEGCNQRTLLDNLDMTSVTALSRNLADLSAITSTKKLGPGFIELRIDVMNLRRKTVHLTDAGRTVVEQLLDYQRQQPT